MRKKNRFYGDALREIESGRRRDDLWGKALANSEGDFLKAKSLYLGLLARELQLEANVPAKLRRRKLISSRVKNWTVGLAILGVMVISLSQLELRISQTPPDLIPNDVTIGFQKFEQLFKSKGIDQVIKASRECHETALSKKSWSSVDKCVAFDFAASEFAIGSYKMGVWPAGSAFGTSLVAQKETSYMRLGSTTTEVNSRIQAIHNNVKELRNKTTITLGDIIRSAN